MLVMFSFSHKSRINSYTGTRWRHRRAVHPPFQERPSPFCDVGLVRPVGDEGGCVQGQDVRDHQGRVSVEKKKRRHFFFFSERTEPFILCSAKVFFCCSNSTLDINAVSHSHRNDKHLDQKWVFHMCHTFCWVIVARYFVVKRQIGLFLFSLIGLYLKFFFVQEKEIREIHFYSDFMVN